jgi:hypothetical protein
MMMFDPCGTDDQLIADVSVHAVAQLVPPLLLPERDT